MCVNQVCGAWCVVWCAQNKCVVLSVLLNLHCNAPGEIVESHIALPYLLVFKYRELNDIIQ